MTQPKLDPLTGTEASPAIPEDWECMYSSTSVDWKKGDNAIYLAHDRLVLVGASGERWLVIAFDSDALVVVPFAGERSSSLVTWTTFYHVASDLLAFVRNSGRVPPSTRLIERSLLEHGSGIEHLNAGPGTSENR